MSTYTDLQNRVKENLTVDYRTRITTQKISAMNEENLFVGTFKGKFCDGTICGVSCVDSTLLSGTAEKQLLVEPLLSVGFDEQTQEPIISSLTSYIAERSGVSGVTQIVAGQNISISPDSGTGIVTISASGGSDISVNEWIDNHFEAGQISDVYVKNSVSVNADLSVGFDRVLDTAEHQLSDVLRNLADTTTVFNVCFRSNEIRTLAGLEDTVPQIDYDADKVEDLFNAVKLIAPSRPSIRTLADVVESLNLALGELKLARKNISLETRLSALSESVYGVADYVDSEMLRVQNQIAYLSSQISSIPFAAAPRLVAAKAGETDAPAQISDGSKSLYEIMYGALSALPSNGRQLDIIAISKALIDLKAVLGALQ